MMRMPKRFLPLRPAYPLPKAAAPKKLKDTSGVDPLAAKKAELKKAARGFEAVFIRQLLHVMNSTVRNGGMFGEGAAGAIYSDIVENSLADVLSERGVLGIGDMLYRQLVVRIDPHETGAREGKYRETVRCEDGGERPV